MESIPRAAFIEGEHVPLLLVFDFNNDRMFSIVQIMALSDLSRHIFLFTNNREFSP